MKKKYGGACSFWRVFCVIRNVKTKDTFDELLHRYRGLLFSLCGRYSHRGVETEDLIQEAAIALWRARGLLLPMSNGLQQAALVWKIARNAVIDTLRRIKETEPLPVGYDGVAEDRTLVHELHELIDRLEEPDRSIVTLQLEGYSYEEIGEQLEMSVKNVSVRLVRAKEKLRKSMNIE